MYTPTHFKFVEPVTDGNTSIDFSVLDFDRPAIFLAGPCPRINYEDDWRWEALEYLDSIEFDGIVVSPTNRHYAEMTDVENAHRNQTHWERIAMYRASAIVFWVPRSKEHPGLNTNVEFGEWYKKKGIFFGYPENAEHMQYLKDKFEEQCGFPAHYLRMLLHNTVACLKNEWSNNGMYFTSDTHFGQQRTLELSRRPFVDVEEMDLNIISNWNKTVGPNATVVHAGDFARTDCSPEEYKKFLTMLLNVLNFGKLEWVLGNYDRKVVADIESVVTWFNATHDKKRVELHHKKFNLTIMDNQGVANKFVVVHEPTNDGESDMTNLVAEDEIMLFGHVHGRSFTKHRGFDLSTDFHRFTPLTTEQVLWYTNSIQYMDENVFD